MFYFETKPRQANPTVYPSNSTPPYPTSPPPKKKKTIHNIISFADRKLVQMHRLTNALDLVVLRKRFPSWPTRANIINRMARPARTPILKYPLLLGLRLLYLYLPRFVNQ